MNNAMLEHAMRAVAVAEERAALPRSTWKPQWLASPVNLPERTLGKLSIVHVLHNTGDVLDVVSMREAILSGTEPASIKLKKPLRVHELREEGKGTWMSDLPCELNQMAEGIYDVQGKLRGRAAGHVLVGGLGLGILPGMLYANRHALGVKSITVVEWNKGVITLCAAKRGYDVVQGDVAAFMRKTTVKFDVFMLDTWQGQNEGTYWGQVLPLQRIIRNRWGARPVVWCWKEREMWGQAYGPLRTHPRHWRHPMLPPFMTHEEALTFLQDVGLPTWEKKYGKAIKR